MHATEIKAGMKVRVKSGKVYTVITDMDGQPSWAYDRATNQRDPETGEVCAIQWQVNDKYPAGRHYGASRYLQIAELTPAE